jgi:hypothetical protein
MEGLVGDLRSKEIQEYKGKYVIYEDGSVWTNYRKNGSERFMTPVPVKKGEIWS